MKFINEKLEKKLENLALELSTCDDDTRKAEIEIELAEISEKLEKLEVKNVRVNDLIKEANCNDDMKKMFQNWALNSNSENFLKLQKLLLENEILEKNKTLNIVKQVPLHIFYENPFFIQTKEIIDGMLNEIVLEKDFTSTEKNIEIFRDDEIKLHNEIYKLKKNVQGVADTLAQAELSQIELEVSEQALKTAKAKSRKEVTDYKKSVKADLKHRLGLNCI